MSYHDVCLLYHTVPRVTDISRSHSSLCIVSFSLSHYAYVPTDIFFLRAYSYRSSTSTDIHLYRSSVLPSVAIFIERHLRYGLRASNKWCICFSLAYTAPEKNPSPPYLIWRCTSPNLPHIPDRLQQPRHRFSFLIPVIGILTNLILHDFLPLHIFWRGSSAPQPRGPHPRTRRW